MTDKKETNASISEVKKVNSIPLQPYKGSQDYFPEDMRIMNYIFSKWREVCLKFGYKEYQTPLLELSDIYKAKSGEDVGNKELFTLTDSGGRELAIRPEMTPSVTRLVSRIYKEAPKPIRLFNISNFLRNERPQKGRNREFWQLNADIFGDDSLDADVEILSLALELMLSVNAPKNSFTLNFNSRKLIDDVLNIIVRTGNYDRIALIRTMDKYEKFENDEAYIKYMLEQGFDNQVVDCTLKYLRSNSLTIIEEFPQLTGMEGYKEISYINEALTALGYADYIAFKPNVIRGFDYYNGIIFEVFDSSPDNNRSLFGGGRYNGLSNIFGIPTFPATGFAPGSETFKIFLQNWRLLPEFSDETCYMPLLENIAFSEALIIANKLRKKGFLIEQGTKYQTVTEALRESGRKNYKKLILFGISEKTRKEVIVKNMITSTQEILSIEL